MGPGKKDTKKQKKKKTKEKYMCCGHILESLCGCRNAKHLPYAVLQWHHTRAPTCQQQNDILSLKEVNIGLLWLIEYDDIIRVYSRAHANRDNWPLARSIYGVECWMLLKPITFANIRFLCMCIYTSHGLECALSRDHSKLFCVPQSIAHVPRTPYVPTNNAAETSNDPPEQFLGNKFTMLKSINHRS